MSFHAATHKMLQMSLGLVPGLAPWGNFLFAIVFALRPQRLELSSLQLVKLGTNRKFAGKNTSRRTA